MSLRYHTTRLLAVLMLLLLVSSASNATVRIDSIPPNSQKTYTGYRLHLTNIEVLKKGGDWIKIRCDLINTGREDVALTKGQILPDELLIQFDESLSNSHLLAYEEQISQALSDQNKVLKAGQVQGSAEIRFSTTGVFTEKGGKVKTKKKKKEKDKKNSFQLADTEDTPAEEPFDKERCPDIQIEQIQVVKKTKNWLTLSYTITNKGKGPARILGKTKSKEDNVAVRANLSSSSRLTKGAIILGGDFFDGNNKELPNGFLQAQESCQGTIKLDIRKMTRYTSVIILELDAHDSIRECDETNNRQYIKVE
ncbi:MAG: hypothetical protein AAFP19_19320 [Bacteroidota bacterium]